MKLFRDEQLLLDSLSYLHVGQPPMHTPMIDRLVSLDYASRDPIGLTKEGARRYEDLLRKKQQPEPESGMKAISELLGE